MPKNRTDYERNASDVVFSSSQQIAHASTGMLLFLGGGEGYWVVDTFGCAA